MILLWWLCIQQIGIWLWVFCCLYNFIFALLCTFSSNSAPKSSYFLARLFFDYFEMCSKAIWKLFSENISETFLLGRGISLNFSTIHQNGECSCSKQFNLRAMGNIFTTNATALNGGKNSFCLWQLQLKVSFYI